MSAPSMSSSSVCPPPALYPSSPTLGVSSLLEEFTRDEVCLLRSPLFELLEVSFLSSIVASYSISVDAAIFLNLEKRL